MVMAMLLITQDRERKTALSKWVGKKGRIKKGVFPSQPSKDMNILKK